MCGHSLGGILAKLLSPISREDTCAFNSPGILEFLNNKMKNFSLEKNQTIVTYVAKQDIVGEYAHHADLGKRILVATSENNKVSVWDIEDPANIITATIKKSMSFHSMRDFFLFMYKNGYESVYLKPAKVHYHFERYNCLTTKANNLGERSALFLKKEYFKIQQNDANAERLCSLYYEKKKLDY